MNIRLCKMTKELAHEFFRGFIVDPALFATDQPFQPYVYSPEKVEHTVERYRELGRVHLAIMLDDSPIGEIVLKKIDPVQRHCTLGISMQCDRFKNKGYGTAAEILALEYAFSEMNLETVYADSLIQNVRSQYVLNKAGFLETHRDAQFVYYRCDRAGWQPKAREIPGNGPV